MFKMVFVILLPLAIELVERYLFNIGVKRDNKEQQK